MRSQVIDVTLRGSCPARFTPNGHTYSFIDYTEFLELLSQSHLLGMPGQSATYLSEKEMLLLREYPVTYPMNSLVVEVILIVAMSFLNATQENQRSVVSEVFQFQGSVIRAVGVVNDGAERQVGSNSGCENCDSLKIGSEYLKAAHSK